MLPGLTTEREVMLSFLPIVQTSCSTTPRRLECWLSSAGASPPVLLHLVPLTSQFTALPSLVLLSAKWGKICPPSLFPSSSSVWARWSPWTLLVSKGRFHSVHLPLPLQQNLYIPLVPASPYIYTTEHIRVACSCVSCNLFFSFALRLHHQGLER